MKKIIRIFIVEFVALYFANEIASGMTFANFLEGMVVASVALAIATRLIKPIISILLLPVTLATLGLFRFLSHAVMLYIVDTALEEFQITSFHFSGFTSTYFDLPAVSSNNAIMGYIAFSILLSFLVTILSWSLK